MRNLPNRTTTRRVVARLLRGVAAVALLSAVGACGVADRLSQVGQAPTLSAIENPVAQPGYKPVQMPMPAPKSTVYTGNSLWRTGSRAFFKDQRAMVVGDILTVRVNFTDRANINNQTERKRENAEDAELTGSVGNTVSRGVSRVVERWLGYPSSGATGAGGSGLFDAQSNSSSRGEGSVRRQEQLTTSIAAVVTQVLPNGNLVIEGKQEVRVNFEVRELIVAGVVRPEDIEADNLIDSTKIAQARIAYGGRGQITDVQQPRYGQQVMDILLPF